MAIVMLGKEVSPFAARRLRSSTLQAASCLVVILAATATRGADEGRGRAAYDESVAPVLREYCSECHGRESSDGRWAFDAYARYADALADQRAWGKVQQLVSNHLMPPLGEAAPTADERRVILEWIDQAVFYVDPNRPDPGPTTLRRLNRVEYNNTVRDVLGVASRPADRFPPDDSGYGFDNIGDVLSVSPLHVEKYLAAAQQVADELMRLTAPPFVGVELRAANLTDIQGSPERIDRLILLRPSEDMVGAVIDVPIASTYRILARVASTRNLGGELDRIEILCDDNLVGELEPTAEWVGMPGSTATAMALVQLPAGQHRIGVRVKALPQEVDARNLLAAVQVVDVSGPFAPAPPQATSCLQEAAPSRMIGAPILRLSGEELEAGTGRTNLDTGRAWLASNGYRHTPLRLNQDGVYRVRFRVGAQQLGDEPVRFEVRLADQTLGPFSVTAQSQAEQWIETQCRLAAGEHAWQVWFVNELVDEQTGAERWLWVHEFSIEGPLNADHGLTRDEASAWLNQVGRRLYRRRLSGDQTDRIAGVFNTAISFGQTPLDAARSGLEALLVSPSFLYHAQPKASGAGQNGSALIDDHTLASRLSYFLWSSAPDEELLSLAERGELRANYDDQIKRMIRDPKGEALTANFAGQWLQLRDLENITPDPEAFPEFDADLAADMRRETELLFAHILRENRPAREFLDADYSMVNARLAMHYGLPDPGAEGFCRVSLAGAPRRGVLTHASVLTLTSHPTRTSPVKRGKWLLEQILGKEPPPAPLDVPPLSEAREDASLPLRSRLEEHVANPACSSCHAFLDPMGFALENYDAIGRWRTLDSGHPIDASGRLVTGESFSDWSELQILLTRGQCQDFLRCLTEHLLTYALGRGVTHHDRVAVDWILAQGESANIGFQDLIVAVCQSVPFQQMRFPSQ